MSYVSRGKDIVEERALIKSSNLPSIIIKMKKSMFLGGLAVLGVCEAFVSLTAPSNHFKLAKEQNSGLNLLPTQGSQLVAAFNAESAKRSIGGEEDEDVKPAAPSSTKEMAKPLSPRSFVARVFAISSELIQRHPHPSIEGLSESVTSPRVENDVVYFPVVGFKYVSIIGEDGEHLTKAVPTEKTNASCRIMKNTEEIYGWFSPGCQVETD